jgi:hypothetical protein
VRQFFYQLPLWFQGIIRHWHFVIHVLKKSRWLFLKLRENLTDKQDLSLAALLHYNLKTIRSLFDERGLSVFLGVPQCVLGRCFFGSMVHASDALPD